MIKERYVSFEVATLLRNKGFNEPCRGVYEEKVLRINTLCDWLNSDFSEYVAAPTKTMACDWIEETFNIAIVLDLTILGYEPIFLNGHKDSNIASTALLTGNDYIPMPVFLNGHKDSNIASSNVNQKDDAPVGDNSDGSWSNKECAYNAALKYVLTNLV